MSSVGIALTRHIRASFPRLCKTISSRDRRCLSTASVNVASVPQERSSHSIKETGAQKSQDQPPIVPSQYRFLYPEFLPDPNPSYRNSLREKLERRDMMMRRTVIDIPEFYVGSIMAVEYSEPHAPGKVNRFVGICIDRKGCGLRAYFLLRNIIDHQGVDIKFELYDPAIRKFECLRLEKRLDETLYYLRDAPPEYSTFPVNMEMEILPEGSPVPVNKIQVPLKPPPWIIRWELYNMKGILPETVKVSEKKQKRADAFQKPWEKYDLMKIYRSTIPEEEQQAIYSEVYSKLHTLEVSRKKMQRKRGFVRPTKGK